MTGNQGHSVENSTEKKVYSVVRYDPCTYEANEMFVYEVVAVPGIRSDNQENLTDLLVKDVSSIQKEQVNQADHIIDRSNNVSNDGNQDELSETEYLGAKNINAELDISEPDTDSVVNQNEKLSRRKSSSGRSKTEGWHICTECSYTVHRRYLLKRHMKVHADKPTFHCDVCSHNFGNAAAFLMHKRSHSASLSINCHACDKKFSRKLDLRIHIRQHHPNEKPIKCPECDYSCIEKPKMDRHMRLHTGARPYQCPHCSYAASDNFNLKRHILSHTGEKPYTCNVCNAKFSQSNDLAAHRGMHLTSRPFACNKCPNTFTRRSDLLRHEMLMHSRLKQYRCKDCQETIADKYQYIIHTRMHKPHKCELCSFAAKTEKMLEIHKLKKHQVGQDSSSTQPVIRGQFQS